MPIKPADEKEDKKAAVHWKSYQSRQPYEAEIKEWFSNGHQWGIGIIAGKVSGKLEIIDIESTALAESWTEFVRSATPGLWQRLVLVRTPRGGMHVFYRCEQIEGSKKLAQSATGETFIETRGEGGYVLGVGSPPECHKLKKVYKLMAGSFDLLPQITPDERELLIDCAKAHNEYFKPRSDPKNKISTNQRRAGDIYNETGNVEELLISKGWIRQGGAQSGIRFIRPDGNRPSATLFSDTRYLWVFSNHAYPFEMDKSYTPFSVYALLEHGGDYGAAAKRLGEEQRKEDEKTSQALGVDKKASDYQRSSNEAWYEKDDSGITYHGIYRGTPFTHQLTNFTAEIIEEIKEDGGDDQITHLLKIKCVVYGQPSTIEIKAKDFRQMNWVMSAMGTQAILHPDRASHAACAIQTFSKAVLRQIYTSTGWYKINGENVFLHQGGALSTKGNIPVAVNLPQALQPCILPDPPSPDVWKKACLEFLNLQGYAPDEMTVPLMPSPILPIIGKTDFSSHISGRTGRGKSSFARLLQSLYGGGFFNKLIAEWESSAGYLEVLAHRAKNMMVVFDEFKPPAEQRKEWNAKAAQIFRAAANDQGRGTLKADRSIRESQPPRGFILSTGEEIPEGHSVGARIARINGRESLSTIEEWQSFTKKAVDGVYAQFLSGFICYVAPNIERIKNEAQNEINELIKQVGAGKDQHKRTPEQIAQLARGWQYILKACVASGAIKESEYQSLYEEKWRLLIKLGKEQAALDAEQDPLNIFTATLESLLSSGRAHVANREGKEPSFGGRYGWRDGRPMGTLIGWIGIGTNEKNFSLYAKDIFLWLDPIATYSALTETLKNRNGFAWNEETLWRSLAEKGWLEKEGNRDTYKVRKTIHGTRKTVISIWEKHLWEIDLEEAE